MPPPPNKYITAILTLTIQEQFFLTPPPKIFQPPHLLNNDCSLNVQLYF